MNRKKEAPGGSISMLVLKLLEEKDMYGYQIIDELEQRSDSTFSLKTGTLYPLLHELENNGFITSYDGDTGNKRIRKYYCLSADGKTALQKKQKEWQHYMGVVNKVLDGGGSYAGI